jgi:hypothetical protein
VIDNDLQSPQSKFWQIMDMIGTDVISGYAKAENVGDWQ